MLAMELLSSNEAVILSAAKDLCTAQGLHRSFTAKDAVQDDIQICVLRTDSSVNGCLSTR